MKMPNVSKILNNKMLQKGAGAYMHIATQATQTGIPATTIIENIVDGAITTPHIPSLQHVLDDLTKGWSRPLLEQLLKLGLVGYALKETGLSVKWGNLAKNFALEAGKGVVIASVITHATIWNSPGPDANSYTRVNFSNAPTINSYDY